ncbi:hypothetical protein [Arthrobacter terrae]|uniref:hypothetical protein n=1 Tax=Arthrobacter terrae TaxID=2935737 RepID=UPI001E3DEE9D|nr:hypothetical protein [Arthrobacter terrae]
MLALSSVAVAPAGALLARLSVNWAMTVFAALFLLGGLVFTFHKPIPLREG